jgi:heme-degrading monooxygenase HmoA
LPAPANRKGGDIMFVKVFIQRPIKEGKDREAFTLLKKLRSNAMNHQGYVTGETLVSTEDPQEMVVVSTWHSLEDWERWKESEDRKAIDALLLEIQAEPTSYRTYTFSKYRLSVKKGLPDALD